VGVKAAYYVENRKRGTAGLGVLLKGPADNVIESLRNTLTDVRQLQKKMSDRLEDL
jgi:hypothetical protein